MFAQSGTPAEIGARSAAVRMQEAGTYASTVPTGDKWLASTTGVTDPYADMRDAAKKKLSDAQTAYAQALQNINAKPAPLDTTSVPSWAQSTIPEGMPGYTPTKTA